MKSLALFLAIGGAFLICGGSFFAIVAPGDGQTGMFAFPLWGLGSLVGIGALVLVVSSREAQEVWLPVALLALVALLSVGWSFDASFTYERDWKRSHPERSSHRPETA